MKSHIGCIKNYRRKGISLDVLSCAEYTEIILCGAAFNIYLALGYHKHGALTGSGQITGSTGGSIGKRAEGCKEGEKKGEKGVDKGEVV